MRVLQLLCCAASAGAILPHVASATPDSGSHAVPQQLVGCDVWPYTSFGSAGVVLSSYSLADVDVRSIGFLNGVHFIFKHMETVPGQVIVRVSIRHARFDVVDSNQFPYWVAENGAFVFGGLAQMDFGSIRRCLSARRYSIAFHADDRHFTFVGETQASDLLTQLQLFAAYITDAGYRMSAFEKARSAALSQSAQAEFTPLGVLGARLPSLLRLRGPKSTYLSSSDVKAARPADIEAILRSAMSTGQIDVTIVGDVTLEQAVTSVSESLGALPPRHVSNAALPVDSSAPFPEGDRHDAWFIHQGREDQGAGAVVWPATGTFGDGESYAASTVLTAIVQLELAEILRGKAGESYAPRSALLLSQWQPEVGYLIAMSDVQPKRLPLFFEAVRKIAADLRDHAVSRDVFLRAQKPLVAHLNLAFNTNMMWAETLDGAQEDPRRLDYLRNARLHLEHVTMADVQRVAGQFLIDQHELRVSVLGTVPQ